MEIINLTPHSLNLLVGEEFVEIPASGKVARVSSETVEQAVPFETDGIRFTTTVYGEVTNLPAPKSGVIYVVSALVAQRVPARDDVFIPNESVRDDKGRICGCRSLGHV